MDPVRFRHKAILLVALISGLPLVSVVFWDHVGVPPDIRELYLGLLFLLANLTPLFLIPLVRYVQRGKLIGIAVAILGFVVLVGTEVVAPPSVTLIDIYRKNLLANRTDPLTLSWLSVKWRKDVLR